MLAKKTITSVLLIVVAITVGVKSVSAATITDLQNQRDTLAREKERNSQQAAQKKKEADQISSQINQLDTNINNTQNKVKSTEQSISSTQESIADLTAKIAQKENELAVQYNNKKETLRTIYETTSDNPVYLLMGDSISEQIDRSDYLESLEAKLESTIDQITQLRNSLTTEKDDLTGKKNDLEKTKSDQVAYQKTLDQQKGQKTQLLGLTQEQAKQYADQAAKLQTEIAKISDQLYAARQALLKKAGGKEVLGSGSSGYPYGSIDDLDAWGFATRECTSYVAWYWNVLLGKKFINTRPGNGSAWNWPALARDQGYSVTSTPRVGAIVTWSAGSLTSKWGHVAIVEAVHNDGTIDVSEYNWLKYSYSQRDNVDPNDYGSHSFIY